MKNKKEFINYKKTIKRVLTYVVEALIIGHLALWGFLISLWFFLSVIFWKFDFSYFIYFWLVIERCALLVSVLAFMYIHIQLEEEE